MKGFEKNLRELEASVQKLEKGGLELADSLGVFETGVKHYKECLRELDVVRERVDVLVQSGGNLETREFVLK